MQKDRKHQQNREMTEFFVLAQKTIIPEILSAPNAVTHHKKNVKKLPETPKNLTRDTVNTKTPLYSTFNRRMFCGLIAVRRCFLPGLCQGF